MKKREATLSRRVFIKRLTFASGVAFLPACRAEGDEQLRPAAAAGMLSGTEESSCNDVSGLTEAQIQTRKAVQYVDKSAVEGKRCNNCRFFKKPAAGTPCGQCEAVPGPIHPQGYCLSWVAA